MRRSADIASRALFPLAFACASTCLANDDVVELRETLKSMWRTIDSLEVEYEQTTFGSDSTRSKPIAVYKSRFCYKSPNKWAIFTTGQVTGKPIEVQCDVRYDGRKEYRVDYVPGDSAVVGKVVARDQEGEGVYYPGAMDPLIWLIVPDRKPVYALLLENEANRPMAFKREFTKTSVEVQVPTRFPNSFFEISLDKNHGYFPSKISMGKRAETEVVRFTRHGTYWFPDLIHNMSTYKENKEHSSIKIASCRFNTLRDDASFRPPRLERGALMVDSNTNKATVVGGKSRFNEFAQKHLKQPTPPLPENPPNRAGDGENQATWVALGLGLASAALLAGLAVLKLRRGR